MTSYARILTLRPSDVGKEHISSLKNAGLTELEILDLIQVIAYFSYARRIVAGLGVCLEADGMTRKSKLWNKHFSMKAKSIRTDDIALWKFLFEAANVVDDVVLRISFQLHFNHPTIQFSDWFFVCLRWFSVLEHIEYDSVKTRGQTLSALWRCEWVWETQHLSWIMELPTPGLWSPSRTKKSRHRP